MYDAEKVIIYDKIKKAEAEHEKFITGWVLIPLVAWLFPGISKWFWGAEQSTILIVSIVIAVIAIPLHYKYHKHNLAKLNLQIQQLENKSTDK